MAETPWVRDYYWAEAASNLWERLCHGRVFDYVHFPKAPGPLRHYVFNLADFAILAGVLALLRKKH